MPFPKGKPKEAAQAAEDGACGLCGKQIDKSENYISGTCSNCGTRSFCFDCVADFLEREVRMMDTKGKTKCDKNLLYARQFPQNILARNTHIISRKPICPGKLGAKDCPGVMDQAELVKPVKAAPAAPAAPAPAPKKPAARPQAAQAMGKAHKASSRPTVPGPAHGPAVPAAGPHRTASTSSFGSSSTTSRPGASRLDYGGGTPTFAQLQLQEEKERKAREREQRAAAAARAKAAADAAGSGPGSAAASSAGASRQLTPQSSFVSPNTPLQYHSGLSGGGDSFSWEVEDDPGAMFFAGEQASDHQPGSATADHLLASAWPDADSPAAWGGQEAEAAGVFGWTDHSQAAAGAASASAGPASGRGSAAGHHAGEEEEDGSPTYDAGFAAGLAAALRQQQEELQRQWRQAAGTPGGHEDLWKVPTQAPAPAPPAPGEFDAGHAGYAGYEAAAPFSAVPASAVPQHSQEEVEEVDELLALMGIA